jgi:hypothetical protein
MSNGFQGVMTVEMLPGDSTSEPWNPIPGPETNGLSLPPEARQQIIDEALRTLRRCVPPIPSQQRRTGLVVGYVQSGKTTSFTTLAALARDNGYQQIIVIAGTTVPLFNQTKDRLIESLRLEDRPRNNPWRHISEPNLRSDSDSMIRETLAQWTSANATPEERKTLLITVMKHHTNLQHLINVLGRVNIQNVSTLIIDDEGDQAGLNTLVNQGRESTTYQKITRLKQMIPQHSYLQYTATPQAPLLINIVDVLSPHFADILNPGSGYTGGIEFFVNQPQLVRNIPDAQIPGPNVQLTTPPETLIDAMRLYFVGVAIGLIAGQPDRNCSMMVHPSQKTDPHQQFHTWVTTVRDNWRQILDLPDNDPDKVELLQDFRRAYDDIRATLVPCPEFEQVSQRLRQAVSSTFIREVNTRGRRKTPKINWGENYSWILVGGQAMDRGFTVEGLTVTYMPRGLGQGNADTVQQRARFFGYKRGYLGLCRIFLGSDVRRAFQSYVEHEEDVHRELRRFNQTGRPLTEWRREFFLDQQMRPTRDNVINTNYFRFSFGNDWLVLNGVHESAEAVEANRVLFTSMRQNHVFQAYDGLDTRRDSRRNLVIPTISLRTVLEEFLTVFRISRLDDSLAFSSLLRIIQLHLIQHPDDTCALFLMSEGNPRQRAYDPEIIDDDGNVTRQGSIRQLFQGRQYAAGTGEQRAMTYPGDRDVKYPERLTVQLSYLNLNLGDGTPLIAENVPHIAIWVPPSVSRDTLVQFQGPGN